MQDSVTEPDRAPDQSGQPTAHAPPQDGAGQGPRLPVGVVAALYLVVCLVPLVLALMRDVAPTVTWEIAAAGLGLIGLAAMAVQFVTSGRFQLISGRLGIDRVMAFHKTAAWWVLGALLLHPLAYVVPTVQADPALGLERLIAYLTLPQYRTGVIALGALALLVLGSALRERLPLRYEAWRGAHVVLAITAVAGGLHHAATVGRFSVLGALQGYWWGVGAAVAGILAVLYGLRWARLHRRPWRLASVTRRADRMWELDIQPAPGTAPMPYRAGQFVWITEGARRFPLFDHPFSIADSPRRAGLRLIVKEAGDFTNRIGDLAPGTPMGVDGPYGHFTLEGHADDAVLLIAGGVGVAPIMGLLRDLRARGHDRPVRLAYAVGTPDNLACADEIAAAAGDLDLETLLLSETPGPDWPGEVGRLDRARLQDMLRDLDPQETMAMMCGPGPMVTAVADTLIDLGLPMERVLYERFDYSEGASRLDRRLRRRFLALGAGLALGLAGFVALLG
ncbi:MAG: ferredoxin reductase family protein [Salibaculum sp.]|uniref:ferredoxin reductase family protein n=1 Tax=Salibaculum sp. TaxID=2855480 RepID=UPI00286FE50D|nr:ferredoxin reductase family protein [Salibaculum sp.]MDR9428446.1 ferredoxin reductase family protein [Salibaculum sp.]